MGGDRGLKHSWARSTSVITREGHDAPSLGNHGNGHNEDDNQPHEQGGCTRKGAPEGIGVEHIAEQTRKLNEYNNEMVP
jgi:hypothetical protein